jgi:hypothetical protein
VPRDDGENRKAPRRPVFGHAIIRGPNFEADCVIRDLSATGAKIQVRSSIELPPEFNLLLLEANTSRHVLLKWRAGDSAGVEFCKSDRSGWPDGTGAHPLPGLSAKPDSPAAPAGSPSAPGTIKAGADQRIAPRRRVLGHCLILAPGIRASGIIRDVSTTGAKLAVASRVKLPPEFHVLDPRTKSARRVSLRWRDGDLAGVQFCEARPRTRNEQTPAELPTIWEV